MVTGSFHHTFLEGLRAQRKHVRINACAPLARSQPRLTSEEGSVLLASSLLYTPHP